MKRLGWIVMVAGLAVAASGCGVVYRSEVVTSGCISAARALGEPIRGARVDSQNWGPGEAEIRFITQDSEEERVIVVKCEIDRDGELGSIKADGKRAEGDVFEAAKKAFIDIARSSAWNNDR